jgi:hypothetical protein
VSITAGFSTDYLFCKPSSLFASSIAPPTVIRFVRWESIEASYICPHSAFRNQVNCICVSVSSPSSSLVIYHHRPFPSRQTLVKHTAYAYNYSLIKYRGKPLLALLDTSSRILLDTIRVLRAFFEFKLHRVLLFEYLLRVVMHLQVTWFALLRLPRSK